MQQTVQLAVSDAALAPRLERAVRHVRPRGPHRAEALRARQGSDPLAVAQQRLADQANVEGRVVEYDGEAPLFGLRADGDEATERHASIHAVPRNLRRVDAVHALSCLGDAHSACEAKQLVALCQHASPLVEASVGDLHDLRVSTERGRLRVGHDEGGRGGQKGVGGGGKKSGWSERGRKRWQERG